MRDRFVPVTSVLPDRFVVHDVQQGRVMRTANGSRIARFDTLAEAQAFADEMERA